MFLIFSDYMYFLNITKMKFGRYIVGLISGLTFGMLFAPKKGSQLREELVRKGGQSSHDALMALFNAFRDAGTDAVGEMRKLSENDQIRSALSLSKEKMHEYLSQIEEGGYDVAAKAQEKVEEFSDLATSVGTKFKSRAVRKHKAVMSALKTRVKRKSVSKKKAAKK